MSDPCLKHNLKGHKRFIRALKFHPNGKDLVTCSEDFSLMTWNIQSAEVRCYRYEGHKNVVTDVDYSKNGKLFASSSLDKTIRLWKPSIRGGSAQIVGTAPIQTVQFSPDCKQILAGSNDKSVKLYDVVTKRFILSLNGHNHWVRCAKFTDCGGNTVASCAGDKSIKLWDAREKKCLHTISTIRSNATKLSIHPNGFYVAVALDSGSVRVYDLRTYDLLQHYFLHNQTTSVAWHANGLHLISAGNEGSMRIIDVMEGRPMYSLQGSNDVISTVDFSPNGEYFACAGADKNVSIWQTNFLTDENTPSDSSYSLSSSNMSEILD